MNFKEWLLTEESPAAQFFYRLSLYPTDAFDGAEALVDPKDVYALQQRWEIETKQGRKFYNLDKNEYMNKRTITMHSKTMPDAGAGFWRHSTKDRANIEVEDADLKYLGYSKNSRSKGSPDTNKSFDVDVDRIFGDSGKEPKSLDRGFDRPFKKVYENITPYIPIGTTRDINTNMGVRSKYVGPDETGEKLSDQPTPMANFGFARKRRRNSYIQNNLGRSHVKPQQPDYYLQSQSSARSHWNPTS